MIVLRAATLAAAATLATTSAFAWPHHHHPGHLRPKAMPSADAMRPAYLGWNWQAEAIARATAAQQASPGLTEELAPDAKETATGGPVGGVPGFSGGR